jgi:hypothetical protein
MPEPDYNELLCGFDGELIKQLEIDGRVVVIETYAGKRIYYAYVGDEKASKDRVAQVLARYGHVAESAFRGGADPTWNFYARYTAEQVPHHGAD